jgi:predicted MFS family arabinose efflux permease
MNTYLACTEPEVAGARARDLRSEADLRALGFWFQVHGLLAAAAMLLTLIALAAQDGRNSDEATWRWLFLVAGLAGSVGWFFAARQLYRLTESGRIASMLLYLVACLVGYAIQGTSHTSGLGAFFFLLGGAFQLWVLLTLFSRRAGRVCAPEYRELIERTPDLRRRFTRSPFFIAYAIMHGLALVARVGGA